MQDSPADRPADDLTGRRRFKPTLWPTLFTIPAVLFMLALGTWQVQRLYWKLALIEQFETRVAAEPVQPPERVENFEEMRYRRIALRGEFLHDKEVLLTGKLFKGTTGFHVVTPLRLSDGRTLLVNRGWIPDKRKLRENRPSTLVEGPVDVEGIVRDPSLKSVFVVANEPEREIWLTVDIDVIARERGLPDLSNYYVDALRPEGALVFPVGATRVISVHNDHLQYAITWFTLAIALMVIYGIYHTQPANKENDGGEAE